MRVRLLPAAAAAALVAVSWFTIPITGQQTAGVSNCPSGHRDRPWMDTTLSPECRAQLALAAMTPDERHLQPRPPVAATRRRGSDERYSRASVCQLVCQTPTRPPEVD